MEFLQQLIEIDKSVFYFINQGLSNGFFDVLLPWMREKWFWAPLYLFIIAFAGFNLKGRFGRFILGFLLVVVLADQLSSKMIKPAVGRTRPCNDTTMVVAQRVSCGGGYSFTSSHATNHFAVAVYLIGVLGSLGRWIRPALITWAGLIAFSQVYVGVHFPGDVLAGAVLGSLVGYGVYRLTSWKGSFRWR